MYADLQIMLQKKGRFSWNFKDLLTFLLLLDLKVNRLTFVVLIFILPPPVLQKASQGEMSEFFCKVSLSDVPVPNISGMEQSDRIASVSTQLRAFSPHFRRVYEQQSDLQPPASLLLSQLSVIRARNSNLASVVNSLYQSLYPNLPGPGPEGEPTKPPLPQNVFQQKIYGCVVLKTYKEFLSNAMREMRMLKSNVCAERMERNVQLF